MRIRLIACEILHRELCAAAAASSNTVDLDFLPKGLHDLGAGPMRERIQSRVDAAGAGPDAIVLGYGLCSNGAAGLIARERPLILPRAHDCLTLFLGSRARYREVFDAFPGTYYHTSGWLEREALPEDLRAASIPVRMGLDRSYEQWVEAYGEENAEYLREEFARSASGYRRHAFIPMGVGPDDRFERLSREMAERKGWEFVRLPGDMGLIRRLADGPWDESEFLTVPPGRRVRASHDASILALE